MTRYAVLSDIHANPVALNAVLDDIDPKGKIEKPGNVKTITKPARADAICCLGDTVVYGPDPVETLNILLERLPKDDGNLNGESWLPLTPLTHWISGNNDYAVGRKLNAEATYGMLLSKLSGESESQISSADERRAAITVSHLWTIRCLMEEGGQEDTFPWVERKIPDVYWDRLKKRISNLVTLDSPTFFDLLKALAFEYTVGDVTLLHASPCEPTGMQGNYLRTEADAEEAFLSQNTRICFFGHTHHAVVFRQVDEQRIFGNVEATRPVVQRNDTNGIMQPSGVVIPLKSSEGKVLINPGSVGQPRDGDPRASYAIYDDQADTVEFRRVPYATQPLVARLHKDFTPKRIDALKKRYPIDPDVPAEKIIRHLAERLEKASW